MVVDTTPSKVKCFSSVRTPRRNRASSSTYNKTMTMLCQDCKKRKSLKAPDRLSDLVTATLKVLPDVEAFISSQRGSFQLKDVTCQQIIVSYWDDFSYVRRRQKFLKVIAKFMARISVLWEFKKHGDSYGDSIAKELGATQKWKDKVKLLLRKKVDRQRRHTAALGTSYCTFNTKCSLLQFNMRLTY